MDAFRSSFLSSSAERIVLSLPIQRSAFFLVSPPSPLEPLRDRRYGGRGSRAVLSSQVAPSICDVPKLGEHDRSQGFETRIVLLQRLATTRRNVTPIVEV